MGHIKRLLAPIILLLSIGAPSHAAIIELSLVIDASGSISRSNFDLQVGAYESIFGSSTFFEDFLNPGDTLYANVILFASSTIEAVPFTEIIDNSSANAFAAAAGAVNRNGIGGLTNTFAGVNLAASTIQDNGINGDRLIIDVSTDGSPNTDSGTPGSARDNALAAAASALAAGITVNAIGVDGIDSNFLNDFTNAGGGFFLEAASFQEFENILRLKLERELTVPVVPPVPPMVPPPTGVPEGQVVYLLGFALAGLGFMRRRQQPHS